MSKISKTVISVYDPANKMGDCSAICVARRNKEGIIEVLESEISNDPKEFEKIKKGFDTKYPESCWLQEIE